MIKLFLNAMEVGKEYDFIANNYNSMSKSELKDILLEYIYAIRNRGDELSDLISDDVADELLSREVFG